MKQRNEILIAQKIFCKAVQTFCNKNSHLDAATGIAAMASGIGGAAFLMMLSQGSTADNVLDGILKIIALTAKAELSDWRSRNEKLQIEKPWKG
jgi:hypothetical protein